MTITLKTLPQATAQEVYDQVKSHLLTQGRTSEDDERCLYFHEGLKCAAGCLIGDDELAMRLDRMSEDGQGWDYLVCEGAVPKDHHKLIRSLQVVHDQYLPSYWEDQLKKVAERYNLAP
jgi:hypothetical protein